MVQTKNVFICEKCSAYFDNENEASECEKILVNPPKYAVGDMINIYSQYMASPSIEKYEIVEVDNKIERTTHDVIYWVFAKLVNKKLRVPERYVHKI
jgi:hypothetical protein